MNDDVEKKLEDINIYCKGCLEKIEVCFAKCNLCEVFRLKQALYTEHENNKLLQMIREKNAKQN